MGLAPPQTRLRARLLYQPVGLDYDINNSATRSSQAVEMLRNVGNTISAWVVSVGEVSSHQWRLFRGR